MKDKTSWNSFTNTPEYIADIESTGGYLSRKDKFMKKKLNKISLLNPLILITKLFKFIHSAVTSHVLELIKTVEFDLNTGEQSFSVRFDLYQRREQMDRFSCRVWEITSSRLDPFLHVHDKGQHQDVSDDAVMVRRSAQLCKCYEDFTAPDPDTALDIVIEDFKLRFEHFTNERTLS